MKTILTSSIALISIFSSCTKAKEYCWECQARDYGTGSSQFEQSNCEDTFQEQDRKMNDFRTQYEGAYDVVCSGTGAG